MKIWECVDCGWRTRKDEITRRAKWHQFMFEHNGFIHKETGK